VIPDPNRLKDVALSFRGKRVVVAGLGAFGGGAAAARYLVSQGADVLVTDLKSEEVLSDSIRLLNDYDVSFRLGGHEGSDFESADLVVANPAIPFRSRYLQAARESDVPITTEIGLFAAKFPGRTIAVTGTSGKTTTTTLLGEMVSNEIPDTMVGGNMGVSLLDNLESSSPHTTAVLELSSFQLRYLGMMAWRPDIAVVTNFAPNHLDIHDDLADYKTCKQQLIAHQIADDVAVLNDDDPESGTWETEASVKRFGLTPLAADGVFVSDGRIVSRHNEEEKPLGLIDELLIPGQHNQANACAAACAAVAAGCGVQVISESLASFAGVEHRLELCGSVRGVAFYNDSIATSPERTVVALRAIEGPIVLIAGGSDKGLDYDALGEVVRERVKQTILIGETAGKMASAIANESVERASTLDEAVQLAVASADDGDAVILSPASASFDMFTNFEERGVRFKALVRELPD
jgi:UDP-N-acetylmuramoylalanine--D-glutamate ligase